MSFEWPMRSPGWQEEAVLEFEKPCEMRRFEVHGCKQGWKSRKGNQQRKALIISTNDSRLKEFLAEKCDHRPEEHEMIEGRETKRSEHYPRKFAKRFIQALGSSKVESDEDVTGEDTSSEEEEEGEVKMRRMELGDEEEVEETQKERETETQEGKGEEGPDKKDDVPEQSERAKEEEALEAEGGVTVEAIKTKEED